MADDREALEVRITGRVQGVGFRVWTLTEARRLGLTGWVRNEPDGAVRALIVGTGPTVSAMIERLRQGPPASSVSKVETNPASPGADPKDFRITH
jgi:acylphosphatase